MAFTTWAAELTRLKDAIAAQGMDKLLQAGYTNASGQTYTFKRYEDIQSQIKFLEQRVSTESNASGGRRRFSLQVGYGGRT